MAVATVVLIGLAIAKPWSLVQTRAPNAETAVSAPAVTLPAQSAIPSTPLGDPKAMACLAGDSAQVVTIERSAGREVRSWIAVRASAATGPLDPGLPTLAIFSTHIVGLGVCAARATSRSSPRVGEEQGRNSSAATVIDVQWITDVSGVPAAVDLGPPTLLPDPLNDLDPALLYGPPPVDAAVPPVNGPSRPSPGGVGASPTPAPATATSPSSSPSFGGQTWRPGVYVIAFRFPSDDLAVMRWLRLDLMAGAGGGA